MGAIASQITSLTIVYSTVYSDADQRKHQSSASLAFVRGIHRGPVNSPHKWPVTRKMSPFDDVIVSYTTVEVRAWMRNYIAPSCVDVITYPFPNSVLLQLIYVGKRHRKNMCRLTHWGRVTHICVGNLTIIGSDNGLSPGRRQAIIWTNAGLFLIGLWGTNFSEILIEILTFLFKKMHLKMSAGKWRPLGLNVLIPCFESDWLLV